MNKKAKVENHKDKNHKDKGTENKTKEAILDSALKIFLAKGYEGTSVWMILEDAGVVTGSFYHFFKSKEDVFKNVVERFLIQYQKQFAAIAADNTHSLIERLDLFMDAIEWNANRYFDQLQADQLHWTIQYALHKRTLQALVFRLNDILNNRIFDFPLDPEGFKLFRKLIL
ncbi:TetR/AcrR family transcriptional regulator [Erysipelotrichaceae bacterium RD49]|nr:TetR/AcrR family transcriptional regulator [Erysipelotrichaceae bacterium RD49]